MTEVKKIEIAKRDVLVDYTVDNKSVAELATKYGIEFQQMKQVLRAYGLTVRKNETEPAPKAKDYQVILVDLGNKVLEEVQPKKAKEPVTA